MAINGEHKNKGSRSRITNYQKILSNNPRSFIFAQLAEEYIKLGEVDRAIKICRAGLEYNPDFFDGLYVLGVAFFKKGLTENSRNIFFRILKKQPEHFLAREALKRMGFSREKIENAIENGDINDIISDDEEEVSMDEVLPDEIVEEDQANINGQQVIAEQKNKQQQVETQSAKRAVPMSSNDVRSAYKPGVEAPKDEEPDPPFEMLAWLKFAIPAFIVVLALAAYFSFDYYTKIQNKQEIESLKSIGTALLADDTAKSYGKLIFKLDPALRKYNKDNDIKALLVETYSRLLIDFDQNHLQYQQNREKIFATFPTESFNSSMMLSAQAYRAFSLKKFGEMRFVIDSAKERGLLTPAMISLDGELAAYDRTFEKAIKLFDKVLSDNPAQIRAMFKKAQSQIKLENFAAAKITLDLLLEKQPEHDRARILLFEAKLAGGISVREVEKELNTFYDAKEKSLAKIPSASLNYLKALILNTLKQKQEALKLCKKSVALYPRADALYLLATIQFEQKLFLEAKQNIRKAIKLNTHKKKFHAFLGRLYFLEDNKTEALTEMEMAIDDSTDELDLLVMAGDAAAKLHMYEKAVVYYERASFVNFRNLDLTKKLILTYIRKQDMKDALRKIDKLLEEHPEDPITYFLSGIYLLAEGSAEKAKIEFNKGLKIDPHNKEIIMELIKLLVKSNEIEKAYKQIKMLANNHPEDVDVLEQLAEFTLASDALKESKELFEKLHKLSPHKVKYKLKIAYLDYLAGQKEQAKKIVESELAKDHNIGYAHILRGVFLFLEGDSKIGEAQIQKGIQLDSKNPAGHFWIGKIKLENNDKTWAKNELEVALECQAVLPKAMYEIGLIHFQKGQYEPAKKRFIEALKIFSMFDEEKRFQVKIFLRLGEIDIMSNRPRQGLALVKRASKLDPSAAEPYYILARDSLDKFRNKSKTIRLLKKAQKLNPEYAAVYYELGLIYMYKERNKEAIKNLNLYLKYDPKGHYAIESKRLIINMGGK